MFSSLIETKIKQLPFHINSSLLETIFDAKQHSSLLEMKKSWLQFHNIVLLLDDLEEFNLGANKEPHLIYVSSSLAPKEKKNSTLNSSMMFLPRVCTRNRKRGQQTHYRGRIQSGGQVPNMDRKHHARQKEKWAISYMCGLLGSQWHLSKR